MNKKLSKHHINVILSQLIILTFVCVIAFIDYFISYEFTYIKIGIWTFTLFVVLIYEIIVNILYHKARVNHKNKTEEPDQKAFNEKFLWFEIFLLLDIIIIIALLTQFFDINIAILLITGFVIFHMISLLVKPYFGIKNRK